MLRQFGWLSGGRLAAAALQAMTILVVARLIEPSQLGLILSIVGAGAFLQMIFDIGISTYVLRERSLGDLQAIQRAASIHATSCIVLALCSMMLILATSMLLNFSAWAFLPIAVSLASDRHSDMRLNILLADGDSRKNVTLLLERRTASLIIFLLLSLAAQVEPTLAYTSAIALASAACLVRTVRSTREVPIFRSKDLHHFSKLVSSTRHYWLNSVASQLRNLDAPLVLLGGGSAASGFYGFASRLVNPLRLVPDAVGNVFLPTAARKPYKIAPFAKISFAVLALITAGLIFMIAVTPAIIPWLAGTAYAGAVLPIQVTCVGLIFGAFSSILSPILLGWGEGKSVAIIATLSNIIGLALIYTLSIAHGATGGAAGLSMAFGLQALLLGAQLVRSKLANGVKPSE